MKRKNKAFKAIARAKAITVKLLKTAPKKSVALICTVIAVAIVATSLTLHFTKSKPQLAESEPVQISTTLTPSSTEAPITATPPETEQQTTAENNINYIAPDTTREPVVKTNSPDNENPFENPEIITIDENNRYMTLVNTNYRIPTDYTPNLKYVCSSDERLDTVVAEAYEKMYEAAAKENIYLTPCSGYRSYELQERNYNNLTAAYEKKGYTHREALIEAAKEIMPPGSSEHNLGFAMDILCVEEWFENTKQFEWLQQNAQDYGFIMRYAKDKQNITGVIYEPWHWRYVGVEEARKIKASGLCLEEYLGKA